ncbi:alpha-1/alpha-2 family phenol-soluble modulin, partial [Staphylococcus pseudintermedius]
DILPNCKMNSSLFTLKHSNKRVRPYPPFNHPHRLKYGYSINKEEVIAMMWADIILGIVKLIKGLIDTFKK